MQLLFITRKFPPMVGGMENVSFALANEFSKKVNTSIIAWGKSQIFLPYFILLVLIKSFYLIPKRKISHVHLGDGLLSPVGVFLKTIFRVKVSITVHGLDVTYKNPLYQLIVSWCLPRLNKIICISNATLDESVRRGVPRDRCIVIPNGVYPDEFKLKSTKTDLERVISRRIKGNIVLLTVGRLVERKGVYWFIKKVFPRLEDNYIYLVVGVGPERERLRVLANEMGVSDRILFLGRVSDLNLKIIYNNADIFIMPNVKVEGDVEGFGIVALEASASGLPVVASNLEGIRDAVQHGLNGLLCKSGSPKEFITQLRKGIQMSKTQISGFIEQNYSWDLISNSYINYIK